MNGLRSSRPDCFWEGRINTNTSPSCLALESFISGEASLDHGKEEARDILSYVR